MASTLKSTASGDGLRDVHSTPAASRSSSHRCFSLVERLPWPGSPNGIGNWLFHCHIAAHVSPTTRLGGPPASHADHHASHQSSAGMAGMVLGVTVTDPDGSQIDCYRGPSGVPTRKLTLEMQTGPGGSGAEPAYGFVQVEGNEPAGRGSVPVPGPTLVLHRGEPVEIALVNRLPESHRDPLARHGAGEFLRRRARLERRRPALDASHRARRIVRRAIHPAARRHLHVPHAPSRRPAADLRSLRPDGRLWNRARSSTRRSITSSSSAAEVPERDAPTLVNGERQPQFVWKAGARHRVRLIHITPDDIFVVSLRTSDGPVSWRPLMKDAAAVPPQLSAPRPASQNNRGRRDVRLRIRSTSRSAQCVARSTESRRQVVPSGARHHQIKGTARRRGTAL